MNSVRLTLAGVVHQDPSGPDRLWKFLEDRRPAGVTLEMSMYSLRFRRENRERLAAALDASLARLDEKAAESGHVRAIRRAIGMPYEYEVLEQWTRRREVSFELVDVSHVARELLAHLDELVSYENLVKLLATPEPDSAEEAERQRRVATKLIGRAKPLTPKDWPVPADPAADEREAAMERRIRRHIERADGQHWIHVGGWEHLLWLEGRPSLFSRLKNLAPQRMVV